MFTANGKDIINGRAPFLCKHLHHKHKKYQYFLYSYGKSTISDSIFYKATASYYSSSVEVLMLVVHVEDTVCMVCTCTTHARSDKITYLPFTIYTPLSNAIKIAIGSNNNNKIYGDGGISMLQHKMLDSYSYSFTKNISATAAALSLLSLSSSLLVYKPNPL